MTTTFTKRHEFSSVDKLKMFIGIVLTTNVVTEIIIRDARCVNGKLEVFVTQPIVQHEAD